MICTLRERARLEERNRIIERANLSIRAEISRKQQNEIDFAFDFLTKLSKERGQTLFCNASDGGRALVTAASFHYESTVRRLIEQGFADVGAVVGKRKETALHFAARAGNSGLVTFLVEKGADLQSRDWRGQVPLHCAAWAGHEDTVRTLLSHGADVNTQDQYGRTALFGAAGCGYLAVVRVLLARGADRGLRGGSKKETALERAEAKGLEEIALELRRSHPNEVHETVTTMALACTNFKDRDT